MINMINVRKCMDRNVANTSSYSQLAPKGRVKIRIIDYSKKVGKRLSNSNL